MANRTLTQATSLAGVDIASNDELWIWDVTAAALRKCTRADLIGGVITGGGTVATNGFTLTVPANGVAAVLPTSTSNFTLAGANLGNNVAGRAFFAGNNTNAGTEGPSSGWIGFLRATSAQSVLWPDTSGNLRIHTTAPTGSTGSPTVPDTAGVVVGTQTSSLDSKNVQGEAAPIDEVLAAVRQGAEAVRRFVYKSGAYNGEEFSGVVVDYAPRYGMDRDADHPAGKSLNVITAIGDLLMAVANLTERVEALERG